MNEQLAALAAPFPPANVSFRIGARTKDKSKGKLLAYIDARDVMERLDDVMGANNWQCSYSPMHNNTTCCNIGILFEGSTSWIWRANGAGATDVEGDKGAYSDAFKRAGVLFGIGRYLYDVDLPWVPLEKGGFKVADFNKTMDDMRARLPGANHINKDKLKAAFAAIGKKLKATTTHEQVDQLLDEEAQMIADMPGGWKKHWEETVATQRKAIRDSGGREPGEDDNEI